MTAMTLWRHHDFYRIRNGFGLDHRRVGDRTFANRDSHDAEAELASHRLESKSKFADERQDKFAGRHSVVQA